MESTLPFHPPALGDLPGTYLAALKQMQVRTIPGFVPDGVDYFLQAEILAPTVAAATYSLNIFTRNEYERLYALAFTLLPQATAGDSLLVSLSDTSGLYLDGVPLDMLGTSTNVALAERFLTGLNIQAEGRQMSYDFTTIGTPTNVPLVAVTQVLTRPQKA